MKNFIYVLIVSSLIVCNPIFLLAKHNYIDNVLTVEEEVQLQLSLLEGASEIYRQAERLDNGNYQIQISGTGGVLALMAYTLLQLQKADPSDMRILDPRQLRYFIQHFELITDIQRIDPEALKYLRTLRETLQDAAITLQSNSSSAAIRRSPNNLNVSSLEANIHNLDEFDDRIVITPSERAPIVLTSDVTASGTTVTIASPRGSPIADPRSHNYTFVGSGRSHDFTDALTRTIKTAPKLSKHLIPGAAAILAFASLVFANDAEAAENEVIETAPVEISPEVFEQIENYIEAEQDILWSLL